MKRNILLLGAGKSSGALIRYFSGKSSGGNWELTVADQSLELAVEKTSGLAGVSAMQLDILDEPGRRDAIRNSSLVISMLPTHMHVDVAVDCIQAGVHLATASYATPEMNALHDEAVRRGVILLNECGLDPGLDHMSAMQLMDGLKRKDAEITSFRSYTGGLVAPESNDNPWGYKFSWNPRNVILAGQGTARYLENGQFRYIPYHRLFDEAEAVTVHTAAGERMHFDGYANRDSLAYRALYGLEKTATLLRGTLRQKNFCRAWHALVLLGLTDDTYVLEDSPHMTYAELVLSFLPPQVPGRTPAEKLASFLHLDPSSEIFRMLLWTGLLSDEPVGMVRATPAQVLQRLLEEKWKLRDTDKDMIVMQHEVTYSELSSANAYEIRSSLVVKGEDRTHTAMAKTVGLPLAMASRLILEGKIKGRGCRIPVHAEIYTPVLEELKESGILFHEEHRALSLSL